MLGWQYNPNRSTESTQSPSTPQLTKPKEQNISRLIDTKGLVVIKVGGIGRGKGIEGHNNLQLHHRLVAGMVVQHGEYS